MLKVLVLNLFIIISSCSSEAELSSERFKNLSKSKDDNQPTGNNTGTNTGTNTGIDTESPEKIPPIYSNQPPSYATPQPAVLISSDNVDGNEPVTIYIRFSEAVTGFTMGDIYVSGGTSSNFTGSGSEYSFQVTPSGGGNIAVNVPAGSAADDDGDLNTSSSQFSLEVQDITAPTAVLANTPASPAATAAYDIDVLNNDGLVSYQFSLVESTASCTTATYNGSWIDEGTNITGNLDAVGWWKICALGKDDANNEQALADATEYAWNYISNRPLPTISSSSNSETSDNPIPITINFNQDVNGFEAGDLIIVGGSASNFSGTGSNYQFDLNPGSNGAITVDVPENSASSSQNALSIAAAQFNIVFDDQAPNNTAIAIAAGDTHTNTENINLTLAADAVSSMYITNTAGCTANGSWENYDISKGWTLANTNGIATVYVKFRDLAENESGCISDTIIHDNITPTAVLAGTPANFVTVPGYDIDVLADEGV
ncbi:MAG: hypothetical protein CMP10_20525, partial [Zetaproteobacteria bacterium]|nr:hypothetical protein [Pseudobdellovibrionaceae bacterium]